MKKISYTSNTEERDIDSIIKSATNIDELCLFLTGDFEVVSCTLCVIQTSLKL